MRAVLALCAFSIAGCTTASADTLTDTALSVRANAIIPGYTHLRRAQPVLWGHYLLAYFEMFARDYERFGEARRDRRQHRIRH